LDLCLYPAHYDPLQHYSTKFKKHVCNNNNNNLKNNPIKS
jgi:hypothetical protein